MDVNDERSQGRAAWIGLAATLILVAAAVAVPLATGWHVHARAHTNSGIAPLHSRWDPTVGPGTAPAVLIAVLGVIWMPSLAERLSWRRLLIAGYAVGAGWLLSLALVDGPSGLSRVLGNPDEYLRTARQVDDVPALLSEYISRIPLHASGHWPVHVAGHPPGMVLFFVALVRVGLGGDLAAGVVVTLIAATLPLAVVTTLRALGQEPAARRAMPFLVLTPAAVFLAVSADAVMAAAVAWGLACIAVATRRGPARGWPWAVLGGLLYGAAVMMSYGLPLAALLVLAVLLAARSWWPLLPSAAAGLAVVLAFAAAGFAWWSAYPVLATRYWDGIASARPAAYWLWGDLAALAISAGPVVGAGVATAWHRRRDETTVALLVAAAALAVGLADLSRMSKAEVERIWLPFVPWLTLGLAILPAGWRRPALAGQVLTALVVQHLLYTSW
ncbi:MAG: hypothetical protein ACXVXB_11680 [Nocardioidaceae bacterium]